MAQKTKVRKIEEEFNNTKRFEYVTLASPIINQNTDIEKIEGQELFKLRRYSKVDLSRKVELQLFSREEALKKAEFLVKSLNSSEFKIIKRRPKEKQSSKIIQIREEQSR